MYRPCGKESTEVQITQNKGKESENLPKIEEFTMDRHMNTHTETKLKYFNGHGRPSQSEDSECVCSCACPP